MGILNIIILALLTLLIVFMVLLIYTLLFGHTTFHMNDFIGKFNRFLINKLPALIPEVAERVLGKKIGGYFRRFYEFMIGKNPFLAIFFLLLFFAGFIGFYIVIYPVIPLFHQVLAMSLVVITLSFFSAAVFSDPGLITEKNYHTHKKNYKYDVDINWPIPQFTPRKCATCLFTKPARSKHCSLCGGCVARYDHHCPWINNCVGANNMRYFLGFLISLSITCMYGTYVCLKVYIWDIFVIEEKLFELRMQYPGGEFKELPMYVLAQVALIRAGTTSIALAFFLFFIAITLVVFTVYAMMTVIKNETSRESSTISSAHSLTYSHNSAVLLANHKRHINNSANQIHHTKSKNEKDEDEDEDDDEINNNNNISNKDKAQKIRKKEELLRNVVNIYDDRSGFQGVMNNIWEIIYPLHHRSTQAIPRSSDLKNSMKITREEYDDVILKLSDVSPYLKRKIKERDEEFQKVVKLFEERKPHPKFNYYLYFAKILIVCIIVIFIIAAAIYYSYYNFLTIN